ncbi:glycosyl transferase family 1 [Nostoc sp. 3335mG]|nr:glycosyl transferase family 1 [Nostoc sp. 3335mG]
MVNQNYLVFVSAADQLCGVEAFTRLLARHFGARGGTKVLDADLAGLWRALGEWDAVVFNFPVVGWKRQLFSPGLAALVARLRGRDNVVVLHEWATLDWKRRVVLAPVVMLATRIGFSAPEVEAEFARSPLSRLATSSRQVVPIPPNVSPDGVPAETGVSRTLARQREAGRLILGQFGSIYPRKQSSVVLDVAADLLRRGEDVAVVFAGSFIKGQDNVEAEFYDKAKTLGLADRVTVTGYIAADDELAAIFRQVDVFCYVFTEGLTARRGSVLAAALAGRPVVVNAPAETHALDHHPLFGRLLAVGAIRLVPTDADIAAVADTVRAARGNPPEALDASAEIERLWAGVCARIDGSLP